MVQTRVDESHSACSGAQHLRSSIEPVTDPFILAMATHGRRRLGCTKRRGPHHSPGDVWVWMVDRTHINFPDQSLRPFWTASGVSLPSRQRVQADPVPNAGPI